MLVQGSGGALALRESCRLVSHSQCPNHLPLLETGSKGSLDGRKQETPQTLAASEPADIYGVLPAGLGATQAWQAQPWPSLPMGLQGSLSRAWGKWAAMAVDSIRTLTWSPSALSQ